MSLGGSIRVPMSPFRTEAAATARLVLQPLTQQRRPEIGQQGQQPGFDDQVELSPLLTHPLHAAPSQTPASILAGSGLTLTH